MFYLLGIKESIYGTFTLMAAFKTPTVEGENGKWPGQLVGP